MLNIQGLSTKRTNKLNSPELNAIFCSHDIVLLTETWTDQYSDLSVDNFDYFVLNRSENKKSSKRSSGGIIVYIRTEFTSKDTLVFHSSDDILCVKISGCKLGLHDDLYICLCYVIPENSCRQAFVETHTYDRLLDHIVSLHSKHETDFNFLLCGDLNSHTSDCPDFVQFDNETNIDVLPDDYCIDFNSSRTSQDKGRLNNNGHLLLDLCKQTGLRILNGRIGNDKNIGRYTYIGHNGSSVVDYIISSQNLLNYVTFFNVDDPNILSDHCLIDFTISFNKTYVSTPISTKEHVSDLKYQYSWNSSKTDDYKESLLKNETKDRLNLFSENINAALNENDVDSCIQEFSDILGEVASPLFKRNHECGENPARGYTYNPKHNNKWYTPECEEKRSCFYSALNLFRLEKTNESRVNMIHARSRYKACIRNAKFEHDKHETRKLLEAKHKNAKLYWKMLKHSAGIKESNIPIDVFEQYFKSVNNPNDPFYIPDDDILFFVERYERNEFNIMFDELNVLFTNAELLKSINQLKTNKSGGPDLYLNEFFIHGKHVLLPYLLSLFNKIFTTGYFPQSWSDGFVIPLHKKGNTDDVNNYRGITLLSTLGKLFTRLLNNRLCNWAEQYSVYIEAQAGFRSNMGTTDNIFVLHGLINHMINKGKQLYCAFIDFSKAFDFINRDNLWTKLIKFGIRGNIFNIIRSMYDSVKSKVKYHNRLSNSFTCQLGVRQGECLSPFLFSMFLNDIEDMFIKNGTNGIDVDMFKIFLILYADDIVIFANNGEELQNNLDMLYDYCNRWRLSVNASKTKIMIFRKGGRLPANINFRYGTCLLEIVQKFVYLGIVFTCGGSFSETQSTLAGQGSKSIFAMNKYLYKFTNLTVKHRLELFDKLVSPILNYGSEIWGFHCGKAIERIQLQFCKHLLGVKNNTQNDFVYGELGRVPLINLRYFNIIKYWTKILHADAKKYISKIYRLLFQDMLDLPNKTNWCSLLRNLLFTLGLNDVWHYQSIGDVDIFLKIVKQRINDQSLQNLNARLNESSRALFYRCIFNFKFQPYLDILSVSKYRVYLSRLRLSSHRLNIEAGRWNKPVRTPVNERICNVCQILEDEYHFVLECSLYDDLRKLYIKTYYWRHPNMYKFVQLMTTENKTILQRLGMFLEKAFKVRANELFNIT